MAVVRKWWLRRRREERDAFIEEPHNFKARDIIHSWYMTPGHEENRVILPLPADSIPYAATYPSTDPLPVTASISSESNANSSLPPRGVGRSKQTASEMRKTYRVGWKSRRCRVRHRTSRCSLCLQLRCTGCLWWFHHEVTSHPR